MYTSEYNAYPPPPGSYYIEDKPQLFYKWLSPPGIIKAMMATVIVLSVAIFACVASTLMWDMQYGMGMGMGYGGGYGGGGYGGGGYGGGGYGGGSYGSGYGGYGGGYGNSHGSYISPYSAKTTMIAMAAINFIGALAFFITSFSKSNTVRSRKFFLALMIASIIMAILQGIISIVYIVGVNPMAQGSSSMMYNPMLMMCQNLYQTSSYSQMGGVGGFPMYNQYLYHYCFVDPQEGVAMMCGFLVVIAFGVAAFFAHKTRGKIWRYGKPNIHWEQPLVSGKASEGRDVEEWVRDNRMVPVITELKMFMLLSSRYSERTTSRPSEAFSHGGRTSSSPSEETGGGRKPSANRGKRRRRNPELDESQYETEYTTGGETGNELDREDTYPDITSDDQRQDYKREFDVDLREYKRLCTEMDDINDQLNKLSRQLDTLDETSAKYQVRYTSDYRTKKKECRRLRHKLFHIKRMVKDYDKNH
uniref:Si:ch73-61d6.3 n=1 Tax=Cyclopterus lumpus TaxID=8103 RepID=A0A8C3AUR6_CYCLU